MNKKMALIGALLIALSVSAKGVDFSGDFSLQTDCIKPAKAFYVLHNDTQTRQSYTIRAVGENSEWIFLGPTHVDGSQGEWIGLKPIKVTLSGNQSEELVAFVKPQNCYVRPGKYFVRIRIETAAMEKALEKAIEVTILPARTIALTISPESTSLSQCETTSFELKVENTGQSNEFVELSVLGVPSNWVELPEAGFVLEKGASRSISLSVTPECGAEIKAYDVEVKATVKGASFTASKTASIQIVDNQKLEIKAETMSACNDTATQAKVEIKNKGRLEDTLYLSVLGPNWVSVKERTIRLAPEQTGEATIAFKESNAKPGNYEFYLKAHSKKFNKDTVQRISVELKDCYGVSLESALINGQAFEAKKTACLEEKPTLALTLKNTREKTISLNASFDGVNARLSQRRLSIASSEAKELKAELELSGEKPGEKEFSLTLESEHFKARYEFSLLLEDCYSLSVSYGALSVDANAGEKAKALTVKLKNTGTKENTVKASVSGLAWVYFERVETKLNPGEEKGLFLYIAPPYDEREGKHAAELSIKAKDFTERKQLTVNVVGGLYSEVGEASVSAESKLESVLEETEKTVELIVSISNEGNSLLMVHDINFLGFNAEHSLKETVLEPGQSIEVKAKLFLGKGWEKEQFTVPMQIATNKGTFTKEVEVDLREEEPKGEVALFSLAGLAAAKEAILIAIVAIAIALAITLAMREKPKQPSETLTSIAKEVQELPAKKLEEIGKKKKRSRKNKKK